MITSLWQLVHLEHVMYDKMYTCIYFRIFWRIITYNLNEGIVFLPIFHTTHLHVTCLRRLRNIWSFSCWYMMLLPSHYWRLEKFMSNTLNRIRETSYWSWVCCCDCPMMEFNQSDPKFQWPHRSWTPF